MSNVVKFGTDGWRGKIAKDYTFDNVRRSAQGFTKYMLDHSADEKGIVVDYDRRFVSEDFAVAAAEVLATHGIHVWPTQGATPTPVISRSVANKKTSAIINTTVGHNPPSDNGFKVRDRCGGAIAPDGLREIAGTKMTGISTLDGYKFSMGDDGWLLIRFSGTEPLIRIYCETTH